MNGTKPALASLGIIGPTVAVLSMVLAGSLGIEIDAETQQVLITQGTAVVTGIVAIVGSVVGFYGRWRANSRISGVVKTGEAS